MCRLKSKRGRGSFSAATNQPFSVFARRQEVSEKAEKRQTSLNNCFEERIHIFVERAHWTNDSQANPETPDEN